MGILITVLDENVAAFAPVYSQGTTSRNPFDSNGVRHITSIVSADNDAGFLRLNVADASDFEVGDTVSVLNTSNSAINVRHEVKAVTSTTITLTTVYSAGATGGVVNRMNEGLNVHISILDESFNVIAVLYAPVNPEDGSFKIDISRALRKKLSNPIQLNTQGGHDTSTLSHSFFVNYSDSFLNKAYENKTIFSTYDETIAHYTTELRADFLSGAKLMTTDNFFDSKIVVQFIMNAVAPIKLKFIEDDGTETSTAALTGVNMHYGYTFVSDESKFVKVAIYDVTEDTRISEFVTFRRIGCKSTILYFINRYGAYVGYEFHNYDDNQKTTKVDKFTGEAWKERKLYGKDYTDSTYSDIRDIVTSPAVYDSQQIEVRVLTESIEYKANSVIPEVVIRYEEDFLQ